MLRNTTSSSPSLLSIFIKILIKYYINIKQSKITLFRNFLNLSDYLIKKNYSIVQVNRSTYILELSFREEIHHFFRIKWSIKYLIRKITVLLSQKGKIEIIQKGQCKLQHIRIHIGLGLHEIMILDPWPNGLC